MLMLEIYFSKLREKTMLSRVTLERMAKNKADLLAVKEAFFLFINKIKVFSKT